MDAKSLMTEFAKMAEPTGALKSGPAHTNSHQASNTAGAHTNGHQASNTANAHTNGQGKGAPTAAEEAIISQMENAIEQKGGNVNFDQILPNNPL
jgi:hypothetical protein